MEETVMENEKKNEKLLDALLAHVDTNNEDKLVDDIKEEDVPEGDAIIELSVSRWVISPSQLNWDDTDLEAIEKVRKVLVSDRFNLIMAETPEARDEMADKVLEKASVIEKNLGIYIDYGEIRDDLTKYESALLAASDVISLYEWLKAQIQYMTLQSRCLTAEDECASLFENSNIEYVANLENENQGNNNETDPYVNYEVKDPAVREALNNHDDNKLISSFMDDHSVSGLLD
jgi:hypothetical protein